jgi:hypothetical protein
MSAHKPADWPPDVDPIALEDLGRLGINPQQELFWDGRRVEIRRRLVLTGFQKSIAFIVTICAILGGLGGFVTGVQQRIGIPLREAYPLSELPASMSRSHPLQSVCDREIQLWGRGGGSPLGLLPLAMLRRSRRTPAVMEPVQTAPGPTIVSGMAATTLVSR